jgi:hypothetical protein
VVNLRLKQAIQALAVFIPLAFLLYFWTASFLLFAGTASAVSSWNVNATVNVTNVAPTVNNMVFDDNVAAPAGQIDLSAGGLLLVYCNATVNDTNGYQDISSARAVIYDGALANPASADNGETHYTNTTCSLNAGSGISRNASCAFSVQHYANNATWTCNLTAFDSDNANGTGATTSAVNLLVALNISTGVLNYGILAPLAESASVTEVISNHGNSIIDFVTNGTSMPCTGVGTIDVSAQHYNVTGTGVTYNTMTALTGSPVTTTAFDLLKRTDSSGERQRTTYWKIQVPVGTKGICTGNVTMAAVVG